VADAIEVVRAWIEALNAGDVERMITLAREDIEFDTPRGVTRGHEELRAFMERQTYGVALWVTPYRDFGEGDVIVVDGLNELRYVDSGEIASSFEGPATFTVRDGRVARFASHHDLATALSAAGLDEHAVISPD
jgi:limonene-1,2-epoxide hydrolase